MTLKSSFSCFSVPLAPLAVLHAAGIFLHAWGTRLAGAVQAASGWFVLLLGMALVAAGTDAAFMQFDRFGWEEAIALDLERTRAIREALAEVTPDQRAAIVLFDVEGYDYAEIAELTDVSVGTVKSRIHRGRLAMRSVLEDRRELFRG